MMNITYQKPMIFENDDLSEGVYMASGAGSANYTASAEIHQRPHNGSGTYKIKIDDPHNGNHTSDTQIVTVSFNQAVNNVKYNSVLSGDGTSTIVLERHGNGYGELQVESDAGLDILSVTISE